VIVDRRMLKEKGAHALYSDGLSIRTETVANARGERPWARTRNETPRSNGATPHKSKTSEKPSSGG
jgi:hypothetical protein